jgi:hypothetical protein
MASRWEEANHENEDEEDEETKTNPNCLLESGVEDVFQQLRKILRSLSIAQDSGSNARVRIVTKESSRGWFGSTHSHHGPTFPL